MLRRTFLGTPLAAFAARTPRETAQELAAVYGHEITDIVYTQTVSLIGRLRLGQREDVAGILEPWLSGSKNSLAKPTASHYSGHLVFGSMADPRAKALLSKAAAMASRDPMDNEMSDSIFMVCPLLAKAGLHDRALEHFRKMEKLCLRGDGLYRHSPLAEVAWGRGNAFPALGLALTIPEIPHGHAGAAAMRASFLALMRALVKHQEAGGMWRQVIDERDAWLEYSCTAMIATAMQHAISRKFLPADTYTPHVERAWAAIEARTAGNGEVVDVCESTGKLKTLDEYLRRKAIRGIDARGGAMGLLVATEVAGLG